MKKFLFLILFGTLSTTAYGQLSNVISQEIEVIHGQNSNFRNYVKNPTCKRNVGDITASSVAAVKNTTSALDGISDCTWNPTASTQTLKWQVKTWEKGLKGRNCEARILYNGDASLVKSYINQNSIKITVDLQLTNSGTSGQVASINYPCGDGSVSTEVVLESTGDAAIVPYAIYTGEATNLGSVAQASFVGGGKWIGVASCSWALTSATWSGFSADAQCTPPAGANLYGSATAPVTNIPAITFASLPPGEYRIEVTGGFTMSSGASDPRFRVHDGTTGSASNPFLHASGATEQAINLVVGRFSYTSAQSNITFQIQGSAAGGQVEIRNDLADYKELEFRVYRLPSQSEQTVRMNQTNYDWTAYTPTIAGGFGVVSASSFFHRRVGRNLEVTGYFISNASVTGTIASMTLPGSLAIDPAYVPVAATTSSQGWKAGNFAIDATTDIPSATMTVHTTTSTSLVYFSGSALIPPNVNVYANGTDEVSVSFSVPILGWVENQNAPLLVGGVTSRTPSQKIIESARIAQAARATKCTSSPCTSYGDYIGWVSSAVRNGTGDYTINFTAGAFSSIPQCSVVPLVADGDRTHTYFPTDASTSDVDIRFHNAADTAIDTAFDLICVGAR